LDLNNIMENSAVHFTTVLVAFLAIMNPIANAPTFIGLTAELDKGIRRRLAFRSVLIAFVIIAVFTLGGRTIFSLFGITLPAFRIAGGILVGLVGYHMLQGAESSVHTTTAEDNTKSQDAVLGIAVSPLAIPVLAGPGTIATAMSFAAESTVPEVIRVLSAFGVVCLITWGAFISGEALQRVLGQNMINVVTRLMGLILAVVGVQMLIAGIEGAVTAAS
jgi:multiple antibiotic resistance protein